MIFTPEQQRLFIRLIGLTFLLGIVIGSWGVLTGIDVYDSVQHFFFLTPTPSFFGGLLGDLQIILDGAVIALIVEVPYMYLQFLASMQMFRIANIFLWDFIKFMRRFMRFLGLFIIGAGFGLLIWKSLKFPNPKLSSSQQAGVGVFLLVILLGFGCASFYLHMQDKRHALQKQQEEQNQREN